MGEVEDVKMYESAGSDGVQVLLTKRDSCTIDSTRNRKVSSYQAEAQHSRKELLRLVVAAMLAAIVARRCIFVQWCG